MKHLSPAQKRMLELYGWPFDLRRTFYKATDCGARVTFNENGTIDIGAIVEGSDACRTITIRAGATRDEIRERVAELEAWANEAWNEANQ